MIQKKENLNQIKKREMKKTCLLLLVLTLFINCRQVEKVVNNSLDDSNYKKVTINKVMQNPNLYNNKKIEIEGFFYFGFEDVSISETIKSSQKERIWIKFNYFNKGFKDNKGNFLFENDKMKSYLGKKIKIKGVYDSKNNGHLGLYKGTIKDITYYGAKE